MLSNRELDPQPFFEILNGLKSKNNIFFIHGNVDYSDYNEFTGEKTTFGKQLESKGCLLLDKPYAIIRGNDTLWISDFISLSDINYFLKQASENINLSNNPENVTHYKLQKQYMLTLKSILGKIQYNDIKLCLTHYPQTKKYYEHETTRKNHDILNYSLIIAGHYHGGQFRIPFYGAVYIPESTSPSRGFFPAQNTVSGLNSWGNFQQYISRGLGASSTIPLFNFRLFNAPEINIIKLVNK